MKYNISNDHINGIVDALGEEYKDLLVEKALAQHGTYDVDQINISTLIKIDEKAKETLYHDERRAKRNRLTAMISILGTVYCLFGLFLLLYHEMRDSFKFDSVEMLPFVTILMGVFAILFSMIMRNVPSIFPLYHRSKDTSKHFNYEIMNVWKQIEGLMVQLTPASEKMTLNDMIEYLVDLKLLSSEDVRSIKKILSLRNLIVHSSGINQDYSSNEIQPLLNDAIKIIKKLQKFENG